MSKPQLISSIFGRGRKRQPPHLISRRKLSISKTATRILKKAGRSLKASTTKVLKNSLRLPLQPWTIFGAISILTIRRDLPIWSNASLLPYGGS